MQIVTFKGQMSTSRSREMVKTILCTYFCYFWRNKNALMQLTQFCGGSHCSLNGFTWVVLYLIVLVLCPAQINISKKWQFANQIWKCVITLIKVLDTYEVILDTYAARQNNLILIGQGHRDDILGFNGNTKWLLFSNTGTELRTSARFVTQYSSKLLTPPKVEVCARTDKVFAKLGIIWILVIHMLCHSLWEAILHHIDNVPY